MYQPSIRAEVITRRTYNRPLDQDETVFESWTGTTERVLDHQQWLWERAQGGDLTQAQHDELRLLGESILDRKSAMSGRTTWLGGTEISRRREASMFNCSALEIATVHDVVDALWLLLQGCGVGFEPIVGTLNGFAQPIQDIQIIRSERTEKGGDEFNRETWDPNSRVWRITVGDSAEAWAKSIGKLLAGKYPAKTLILDFSQIRPAGTRLKGYGWISSGDGSIAKAYTKIAEILNRRAGCLLTHIDILDIINWLGTILSSRRSSEIALYSYDAPGWEDFATAKYEVDPFHPLNPQRSQSNNTLKFFEKPSKGELRRLFDMMLESGGSEPGLLNAAEMRRRAPWARLVNPCGEILLANRGFCVAGHTPLITRVECAPIESLVGREVEVWNGVEWSPVRPRLTQRGCKLLRVRFGDGSYLDCTEYHRFSVKDRFDKQYREVEAKDLKGCGRYAVHTEPFTMMYEDGVAEPQAYTYGVLLGDGSVYRSDTRKGGYAVELALYGEKRFLPVSGTKSDLRYLNGPLNEPAVEVSALGTTIDAQRLLRLKAGCLDEVFLWDADSILAFLAGWIDADGSVTREGGVRLYAASESAIRQAQLLLTKCGVRSSVNLMQEARVRTNKGQRRRAMWYLQITDARRLPCHRVPVSRGHTPRCKGKWQVIRDVEELPGLHDVYCFEEKGRHKAVFNNTLTYQCNLSELDLAKFRSVQEMQRAAYYIARANYRQTCVNLDDGILQRAWHETNEFLRLCGVGLTGVVRRDDLTDHDFISLKNAAVQGAYSMADELGLPRPKNVTCIKPSGTMSKCYDTTEGAHRPMGRYIFNNVIFSRFSEQLPSLREAGYRIQPHPFNDDDVLVTLPVEWPDVKFGNKAGMAVNTESAVAQLERYKRLMRTYVEQNCSITVSYDPKEAPSIVSWLDKNWDSYVGVSFLLRADPTKTAKDLGYAYLPQEVVTEQAYKAYVAGLSPVSLVDSTISESLDDDCASGACPVR